MQIAAEIVKTPARVWGKPPRNLDLDLFKLKFVTEAIKPVDGGLTDEQSTQLRADMAKAAWIGRVGKPSKKLKRLKE